jgi:hypothetical protein
MEPLNPKGRLTLIRYGGETVKSLSTYVAGAEYVKNEVSS